MFEVSTDLTIIEKSKKARKKHPILIKCVD